jgi:hypothetical protein
MDAKQFGMNALSRCCREFVLVLASEPLPKVSETDLIKQKKTEEFNFTSPKTTINNLVQSKTDVFPELVDNFNKRLRLIAKNYVELVFKLECEIKDPDYLRNKQNLIEHMTELIKALKEIYDVKFLKVIDDFTDYLKVIVEELSHTVDPSVSSP